jgi:hypothetical protein
MASGLFGNPLTEIQNPKGNLGPSLDPVQREQLLRRNVKRFQGGLVFKAHRPLHHTTPGSSVIKKKTKKFTWVFARVGPSSSSLLLAPQALSDKKVYEP